MDPISILIAKGILNKGISVIIEQFTTPQCCICAKKTHDIFTSKCCNSTICGFCTGISIKAGWFGNKYFKCPKCNVEKKIS